MSQHEIFSEPIFSNGISAVTRYGCVDKEQLMAMVNRRVAAIDFIRCPRASKPWQRSDGLWLMDLTYHGVD